VNGHMQRESSEIEWVRLLWFYKRWANDNRLFPRTAIAVGTEDMRFATAGLMRAHWSDASPIRRVIRETFEAAGLPYSNPHAIRQTLVMRGEKVCRTPCRRADDRLQLRRGFAGTAGGDHPLARGQRWGEGGNRRRPVVPIECVEPG